MMQSSRGHLQLAAQVGAAIHIGNQLLPQVRHYHMHLAPWPCPQLTQQPALSHSPSATRTQQVVLSSLKNGVITEVASVPSLMEHNFGAM